MVQQNNELNFPLLVNGVECSAQGTTETKLINYQYDSSNCFLDVKNMDGVEISSSGIVLEDPR